MIESGELTVVGLIATFLGAVFAFAAFLNSRARKAKKGAGAQEGPPGLPFLSPAEETSAGLKSVAWPRYSSNDLTQFDQEQSPTKSAFRQMQVAGRPADSNEQFYTDEYLWE